MLRWMISAVESNERITVLTDSELQNLDGTVGNFRASVSVGPRRVNGKCTLCGECVPACPVEVPNEFEYGLNSRKAIYRPFAQSSPALYAVDGGACTKCGKCVEVCKYGAVDLAEKPSVLDLEVGAVVLATGYDPYLPPQGEFGYGKSSRVITLFALERMLDGDGPTGGELVIDGMVPRSIAFIMCVGSMGTTPNAQNYCSRMCCATTLRNALKIKEKYPSTDVYLLYKNITTYARGDERLYEAVGEKLGKFVRFEEAPEVSVSEKGVDVNVFETVIQDRISISVDGLVLSVGMIPRSDAPSVRAVTKVGCGTDGFLREAHLKLRPVEAPSDGIYLAGTVTGPRSIIESVMSGSAAAAKAAALLVKGYVDIEPIVAMVNEKACSGCSICLAMCPFGAISLKNAAVGRVAYVESALCKGCGVCIAACPSGALSEPVYTDLQLKAQIASCLLEGGEAS